MMAIPKKSIAAVVTLAVSLLAGVNYSGGLEGNPKKPYQDIGGVWTDCYGNTKDVSPNRIRSDAECQALINGEAERIAIAIEPMLTRTPSPKTYAAFVSFTYNVGITAFKNSTLLKMWNMGFGVGACTQMFQWVYVKKRYVQGLYNRRKIEYAMCMEGLK